MTDPWMLCPKPRLAPLPGLSAYDIPAVRLMLCALHKQHAGLGADHKSKLPGRTSQLTEQRVYTGVEEFWKIFRSITVVVTRTITVIKNTVKIKTNSRNKML